MNLQRLTDLGRAGLFNHIRGAILSLSVVAMCGACGAGGFMVARAHYRTTDPTHIGIRMRAIASQANLAPFGTVVIGDSIVELADITTLCGERALNAGIGAVRIAQLEPVLTQILAEQHPKRVIISAGLNDALKTATTTPAEYRASLQGLVHQARSAGAEVRVTSIGPVAKTGAISEAAFDLKRMEQFNAIVRDVGEPIPTRKALGGDRLPADFTTDGTHLSPKGYKRWSGALQTACRPINAL